MMIAKAILQYNERIVSSIMNGHRWVCFGAGRCFREFIQKYCIKRKMLPLPECCFDSNQNYIGKSIDSVPIVNPEILKLNQFDDAIMVVCSVLPYDIISLVKKYSWAIEAYPLREIELYLLYSNNVDRFKALYGLMYEKTSKQLFKTFMSGTMSGYIYFPYLFSPEPYWGNDVIPNLYAGQTIVYGGGAKGESLDRALLLNEDVIIYCFEPNIKQYVGLMDKYKYRKNVILYNYGLSDEEKIGKFDNTKGYASRVIDEDYGDESEKVEEIKLQSIDNVIKDKKIDLIALDIEGAELKALHGAQNLIKKYHPSLAISVYHKMEHYIEIPLFIKTLHSDYNIYFRQHSMTPAESVIYAL